MTSSVYPLTGLTHSAACQRSHRGAPRRRIRTAGSLASRVCSVQYGVTSGCAGAGSGSEFASSGLQQSYCTGADRPMVSVIVPVYNCDEYLRDAIQSVIAQTYTEWELLLVDDCSTDGSVLIASEYAANDSRIKLLRQAQNTGAAAARNCALEAAQGRYIAYLDADDAWFDTKLEAQLQFMGLHGIGMCFTSYETVNESGGHRNFIRVPAVTDYRRFLRRPITCTHTVMFDTNLIPKAMLRMPLLERRQDGATWLAILRTGVVAHGLDMCLAKNRKRRSSLSSNKVAAVRQTWHLYRHIEGLSFPYALYCISWQVLHAVIKRRGSLGPLRHPVSRHDRLAVVSQETEGLVQRGRGK